MRLAKLLSPWSLWAGFVLAILAAAAIGLNSVREGREAAAWSNWIIHTQRVLAALDHARTTSFEVFYAASYEQPGNTSRQANQLADSIGSLRRQAVELHYLTSDNREQQIRLAVIDRLQQRLEARRELASGKRQRPQAITRAGCSLLPGCGTSSTRCASSWTRCRRPSAGF